MADNNQKYALAREKLHFARSRYDAALHEYMAALTAFEMVFKGPLKGLSKVADKRSKPRAKLACDAELRAFVETRLDRMSLHQIADEVAAKFPHDRRVSVSAINRWDAKVRAQKSTMQTSSPTAKS